MQLSRTFRAIVCVAAFVASNVSAATHSEVEQKVRQELARVHHSDLLLLFNGVYYQLGTRGFAHEHEAAKHYAKWLQEREGKNFLLVPGYGKMNTPGVDGAVFDQDATLPEKRVSLKYIGRPGRYPALRIAKVINEASESARKHATLEGTFDYVFPRWKRRLDQLIPARVKMLAAVGLRTEKVLPTVVVVLIEESPGLDLNRLAAEVAEKLLTGDKVTPEEVVLLTKEQTASLKARIDYPLRATKTLSCDRRMVD